MRTIIGNGDPHVTPNTIRRKGEAFWCVSLTIPAGNFRMESLSPAENIGEAQAMAEVSTRLWSRGGFATASDAKIPQEVWEWCKLDRDAYWAAGDSVFPKALHRA